MTDIYIKNGKTVDDKPIEIAIEGNKIVNVGEKLNIAEAGTVIDLNHASMVSAGWIDGHTHCFENMTLYGDDPDKIGYSKGVTAVIDAGSTGADNVEEFYQIAKKAKTNVYALLNVSRTGIIAQNELSRMEDIDGTLVEEMLEKFPNFLVGIKARISQSVVGENGIEPLKKAKAIQNKCNHIPLMVHIGSAPPHLDEVLAQLDRGDIVTHCYNGKSNGILNENGEVEDFVLEAYNRGVLFDLGHGTDSFNFETAEKAKETCFVCNSVSTDIYRRNRKNGPVFDFPTTLEKMLSLGYSLSELIPMVTEHPAEMFHLKNKGKLEKDFDADITIFNVVEKEKTLHDSNGNTRTTSQVVQPVYTIIGGKVYAVGE